jgi:hypothetical protein
MNPIPKARMMMSDATVQALSVLALLPAWFIIVVVTTRLARVRIRRRNVMRNVGRAGIPKSTRMWMWDHE